MKKIGLFFAQIFISPLKLRTRWCHFFSILDWTLSPLAIKYYECTVSQSLIRLKFQLNLFRSIFKCDIREAFCFAFAPATWNQFVHHKFNGSAWNTLPRKKNDNFSNFPFRKWRNVQILWFSFIERTFTMEHSSLWRSFRFDTMAIFCTKYRR